MECCKGIDQKKCTSFAVLGVSTAVCITAIVLTCLIFNHTLMPNARFDAVERAFSALTIVGSGSGLIAIGSIMSLYGCFKEK